MLTFIRNHGVILQNVYTILRINGNGRVTKFFHILAVIWCHWFYCSHFDWYVQLYHTVVLICISVWLIILNVFSGDHLLSVDLFRMISSLKTFWREYTLYNFNSFKCMEFCFSAQDNSVSLNVLWMFKKTRIFWYGWVEWFMFVN